LIQDYLVKTTTSEAKKILLVDSDYDFLSVLSQFLKREGYKTITAVDGEEGLNKALVESPDLIILEPMLSKIHGFTLCNMVTSEFKKQIPVIIVTKHLEEEHFRKEALHDHGASAYMIRPITKNELRKVIEDVSENGKNEEQSAEEILQHPDLISGSGHPPGVEKARAASTGLDEKARQNKPGRWKSSLNSIRERLHTAIDKDEISYENYQERSIQRKKPKPGTIEDKKNEARPEKGPARAQARHDGNNGKDPARPDKVDEMLAQIMMEFGLKSSKASRNEKQPD